MQQTTHTQTHIYSVSIRRNLFGSPVVSPSLNWLTGLMRGWVAAPPSICRPLISPGRQAHTHTNTHTFEIYVETCTKGTKHSHIHRLQWQSLRPWHRLGLNPSQWQVFSVCLPVCVIAHWPHMSLDHTLASITHTHWLRYTAGCLWPRFIWWQSERLIRLIGFSCQWKKTDIDTNKITAETSEDTLVQVS